MYLRFTFDKAATIAISIELHSVGVVSRLKSQIHSSRFLALSSVELKSVMLKFIRKRGRINFKAA